MQSGRDELFKQLGELKFQNEWLKKATLMPRNERVKLLDWQDAKISVSNQCRWLGINRSSEYYEHRAFTDLQ
jgi:hypothetical protein